MFEVIKDATIGNKLFIFLVVVSVALFVASWLWPPTSIVDDSVLSGMGWLFAFGCLDTLRDAIRRGIDAKLTKGDTSIEINNPDRCPGARVVEGKVEEVREGLD